LPCDASNVALKNPNEEVRVCTLRLLNVEKMGDQSLLKYSLAVMGDDVKKLSFLFCS